MELGHIPATHWPDGKFIPGVALPDRSKGGIRRRMLAVLQEDTTDTTLDTTCSRAEAIARAIAVRAQAGNVQAAQLLLDQTEDPIDKRGNDPSYHVTIHYVHQQLNVAPDAALSPPTPPNE